MPCFRPRRGVWHEWGGADGGPARHSKRFPAPLPSGGVDGMLEQGCRDESRRKPLRISRRREGDSCGGGGARADGCRVRHDRGASRRQPLDSLLRGRSREPARDDALHRPRRPRARPQGASLHARRGSRRPSVGGRERLPPSRDRAGRREPGGRRPLVARGAAQSSWPQP
jgi:hypothetical protein